jgi:hypothetical protein
MSNFSCNFYKQIDCGSAGAPNLVGAHQDMFSGTYPGATRLIGATVYLKHNHEGGRVFSKIYHGMWEGYFEI